ncbi:hypothetical protein [Pseudomonas kurunegalensis]|uniref:hypothetical protein n=1 Tax=Pseudomonas kurunegalensis TaxID=485880 RepID=UPI004027A865
MKFKLKGMAALVARLEKLAQEEVKVGIFEDSKYGPENDNLPVAQVAVWQEEGTTTSPRRPFMSTTMSNPEVEDVIKFGMKAATAAVAHKTKPDKFLDEMGEAVAAFMQMTAYDWPGSNAASTIKSKGFDDPLLHTGKMIDSITYQR